MGLKDAADGAEEGLAALKNDKGKTLAEVFAEEGHPLLELTAPQRRVLSNVIATFAQEAKSAEGVPRSIRQGPFRPSRNGPGWSRSAHARAALAAKIASLDALRAQPMGTPVTPSAPAAPAAPPAAPLPPLASPVEARAWESFKARMNGPRPFERPTSVEALSRRIDVLSRELGQAQLLLSSPNQSNKAHYYAQAMGFAAEVDALLQQDARSRVGRNISAQHGLWKHCRDRLLALKRVAEDLPKPDAEAAPEAPDAVPLGIWDVIRATLGRLEPFVRSDAKDRSTLRCPCGAEYTWTLIDPGLGPWVEEHRPHALAKFDEVNMAKVKETAAPYAETDSIINTIPKAPDADAPAAASPWTLPWTSPDAWVPPAKPMRKLQQPDVGYEQMWQTIKGLSLRFGALLQSDVPIDVHQAELVEIKTSLEALLPMIAWMQSCSHQPETWSRLTNAVNSLLTGVRSVTPRTDASSAPSEASIDTPPPADNQERVRRLVNAFEDIPLTPVTAEHASPSYPATLSREAALSAYLEQARKERDAALAERDVERNNAAYAVKGRDAVQRELDAAKSAVEQLSGERHNLILGADALRLELDAAQKAHALASSNEQALSRCVDDLRRELNALRNTYNNEVKVPATPAAPEEAAPEAKPEETYETYARATANAPATLQKLLSEKQVYEAPTATPLSRAQTAILAECDAVAAMLIKKNKSYGNSALEPVRIFSRASAQEQILVRLDDKLSRLSRANGDHLGEDVILDILGYLILLRVQTRLGAAS